MASAHTMSHLQGRHLLVPSEQLNVQGRGLSPQPMNDASMVSMTSSRSSISDDDEDASHMSEEYTVLDGVREMNHILVRQIETLRLKIQVDEKNSEKDKSNLKQEKEKELGKKESEIEDLKDSLDNRDERISDLVRAGYVKDRHIKNKSQEIESLKELVNESKKYAEKLHKQITRVVSDKDRLEDDPLYKKQNEEMSKLTVELETLRERLASMEQELQRAVKIIDSQNQKMKTIMDEKSLIHAKFREELDRVSKAMRQEVERMREVMRQNYEEMRNLREENKQMHDDVRDIKEMLIATRISGNGQNSDHYESITDIQRPVTVNPSQLSNTKHAYSQLKGGPSKGPGSLVGGNIAQKPSARFQRNLTTRELDASKGVQGIGRENTQMSTRQARTSFRSTNSVSNNYEAHSQNNIATNSRSPVRSSMDTSRSNLSPDASARPLDHHGSGYAPSSSQRMHGAGDYSANNASNRQSPYHPNVPQHSERYVNESKNFPPICSFKEGATSIQGKKSVVRATPKSAIRKGSAVRKL